MAVADEIVDLYSTVLNGALKHYSDIAGAQAIELLMKPALAKAAEEHKFLEPVKAGGGSLEMADLDLGTDIEVMKNGFNTMTKGISDSLSYVFGRDEVIKRVRSLYFEAAAQREKLVHDAKISDGLPAFLKEEIWEEV